MEITMPAKKESGEKKTSSRKKKTTAAAAVEVTETPASQDAVKAAEDDAKPVQEEAAPAPSEPEVSAHSEISAVADSERCSEVDASVQAKDEAKAEEAPAFVDKTPRYDIMITSERPGYKPPKAAFAAMVNQLAYRQFCAPVEEAVAETWVEVYFQPSVAAHEIFIEKAYNSDIEVFKEICLKASDKAFTCEYSKTPLRPLYWAIEIRGCRYKDVLGSFRKIFQAAFNLRIETAVRDFTALPEHRTVPVEEIPPEKKKHEKGLGLVGTNVEEM